jgi:hypothetical protein
MKFYRYEAESQTLGQDHDGEYTVPLPFPFVTLKLKEYDLISETPKGYWVGFWGRKFKWVPKNSKKAFAYTDKSRALENYIKRTETSIKIMKARLEIAEIGLEKAKKMEI